MLRFSNEEFLKHRDVIITAIDHALIASGRTPPRTAFSGSTLPQGEGRLSIVIAVDGTAASGKGTLAKRLARHFQFAHLDSGSLYRLVRWRWLRRRASRRTRSTQSTPRMRSTSHARAIRRSAPMPSARRRLSSVLIPGVRGGVASVPARLRGPACGREQRGGGSTAGTSARSSVPRRPPNCSSTRGRKSAPIAAGKSCKVLELLAMKPISATNSLLAMRPTATVRFRP